jgi:hypothetical protein
VRAGMVVSWRGGAAESWRDGVRGVGGTSGSGGGGGGVAVPMGVSGVRVAM